MTRWKQLQYADTLLSKPPSRPGGVQGEADGPWQTRKLLFLERRGEGDDIQNLNCKTSVRVRHCHVKHVHSTRLSPRLSFRDYFDKTQLEEMLCFQKEETSAYHLNLSSTIKPGWWKDCVCDSQLLQDSVCHGKISLRNEKPLLILEVTVNAKVIRDPKKWYYVLMSSVI